MALRAFDGKARTLSGQTEVTPRQNEVLLLRTQGYSYTQIAEKLKISQTRAYQLSKQAMAKYCPIMEEEAKHQRELQYGRLDQLLTEVHQILGASVDPEIKLKAIQRAESIIMYQAKLYGVDVTRIEAVIRAPWEELLADAVVTVDVAELPPAEDADVIDTEAYEDGDG